MNRALRRVHFGLVLGLGCATLTFFSLAIRSRPARTKSDPSASPTLRARPIVNEPLLRDDEISHSVAAGAMVFRFGNRDGEPVVEVRADGSLREPDCLLYAATDSVELADRDLPAKGTRLLGSLGPGAQIAARLRPDERAVLVHGLARRRTIASVPVAAGGER